MTSGTRLLPALLALLVAVGLLVGCDDVPEPGRTDVDVDTAELRRLKDEARIEPCAEGPGGGGLPAITLPCLGGGESVDLSSLTGPMVINTWASNCTPCKKEMPALQSFHEQYGDRVAVLGIDFIDTQPGAALSLAKELGATYPSLADVEGLLLEQDDVRIINGNPQFLLLDESGEVVHQQAGGLDSVDEVVAMVNDHLGVGL